MVGEEASDEFELDNREWLRAEKVGVTGDGASDEVEDREGQRACPSDATSEDTHAADSFSFFFLASTIPGSRRGRSSRISARVRVLRCMCVGKSRKVYLSGTVTILCNRNKSNNLDSF